MEKEKKQLFRLEVLVKNRKNKSTGNSFKSYCCRKADSDEKWTDLRFTKEVTNLPQSHSIIYVPVNDLNIDRRNQYPKIWVKSVDRIEVIDKPIEDLSQYFEVVEEEI